jgi:hypothetical protein
VNSERQRVRGVLYRVTRALNDDGGALNSASRRRRGRDGQVNRFTGQLSGTHWTRRGVRFELNAMLLTRYADAWALNACAFDLNAGAFDLNACALDLNAGAFVLNKRTCARYDDCPLLYSCAFGRHE